ncbi:hypothetical protein PFISCL1PPCAC_13319, partial [Pristionchus fissidentatus]
IVLWLYNSLQLQQLKRRGAAAFDRYSLSRTYQLRENMVVMKMFIRFAGPGAVASVPLFAFTAAYQLLPQDYRFWRNLSIVMVDWWMAVASVVALVVFSYSDRRFRKAAFKL